MNIRKDCLHYHEEPYMGARVDCCLAETAFGMCPCTPDCENYIPKDSSVRIVRCKDCIHRDPENKKCIVLQLPRDDNWFCADGERREERAGWGM